MTGRVTELADQLQGTCDSIGDEQDDWSQEEFQEFDNLVFCCDECGWWFETGEMADDETGLYCTECRPDDDE